MEPSLDHSLASPLIPAARYLRCIDLISEFILNLGIFLLLEVIDSLLLVLGDKQVAHGLVLLGERDHLLLFGIKSLQIGGCIE